MRKNMLFKKTVCLILAVTMCFGGIEAFAADANYYVYFKDDVTGVTNSNQTIVEGAPITITTKLPKDYKFTDPPFVVRKGSGTTTSDLIPDIKTIFTIPGGDGATNVYSITPVVGVLADSGKNSQDYTLQPTYTAVIDEGKADISYFNSHDPTYDINLSVDVTSERNLSIISNSSVTFTVANHANVASAPTFNPIAASGAVTGDFVGKYDGQNVRVVNYKYSGSKMALTLSITPPIGSGDTEPLIFSMDITGIGSNYLFQPGTTFTVSFTRQTINSLIATVITRQKAVDDAKAHVLDHTTDPAATYNNRPYIQLAEGETLESIQNNFVVLSNVHRYNIDVDLEWKWVPDVAAYQEFVKIEKHPRDPKAHNVTIQNRPEGDMAGYLTVKAIYKYFDEKTKQEAIKESELGYVRVNFYGTGKPPEIRPLQHYTGKQDGTETVTTFSAFPATFNMDVYNGNPPYGAHTSAADKAKPTDPYRADVFMYMGEGRGYADYAIINQNSTGGEVEVYIGNSARPYSFGTKIPNSTGSGTDLYIRALKMGTTELVIEFYNSSNELMGNYTFKQNIYVSDSTPQKDARLEKLVMKGTITGDYRSEYDEIFDTVYPNGIIDYGFNKDNYEYTVVVPYSVGHISLSPTLPPSTGADPEISFIHNGATELISSGLDSYELDLNEIEKDYVIRVMVTAQDGSSMSYTLTIRRSSRSADSSLSAFEAFLPEKKTENLIEGFAPSTYAYTITVPYSVTEIEANAVPNSPWVMLTDGKPVVWEGPLKQQNLIQRVLNFFGRENTSNTFIINRPVADSAGNFPPSATTKITARVTAEDETSYSVYTLTVISLAPNTNNLVDSLTISANGVSVPFEYGIKFNPETDNYLVRIPYSTDNMEIVAQAQDKETSLDMELTWSVDDYNKNTTASPSVYKPNIPTSFLTRKMDPKQFSGDVDPNLKPFFFTLKVQAESQKWTNPVYQVEVQRNDPSDDNRLKLITVTDQDGAAVPTFSFNPEQLHYDISVPFLTTTVTVTPTVNFPLAKVSINGKEITASKPSYTTKTLSVTEVNTIEIIVTAEDFSTRTYVIDVTREKASTEARLSSLATGGLELDPKFNPNHFKYKITIPEGTQGIIVTPTAVSQYATITVDDIAVASGTAAPKITPLDAYTKINIVVTAQDGKTKNTYVLNVTDENLIEKSDNADLYDLKFITGDLNPAFRPSILEYEVYVKEDTYSVVIEPKTSNRHAEMKVFADSLEIGDYEGEYAVSLFDDETEITIEVTSEDKSVTKEYVINIFRGDEEKQGIYNPIEEEEVNFEVEDPIVIDISKYPIVAASVFNTLKTDYPDKSILFTGNDYTLSIKGSDMKKLVPNTDYFDFSITFSPPDEEDIWETIADLDRDNEGLDPVYIHFNHHGALPAPMKFTISLGSAYRNTELYWNYYNQERERIDYYGFVITNGKGTFSLPLTHMSTYVATEERIVEAEDKVGGLEGYFANANPEYLASNYTAGKPNPNTGAEVN